jgi:peptidylprolyl isomerase
VTVGTDRPRLPGLGTGLVGLAEGQTVTVAVPAEQAHGIYDPGRVRRVARTRFRDDQTLATGLRVPMHDDRGRVRVVEVRGRVVVVDTNHPRCGQSVELEVELVTILAAAPEVGHRGP